MRIISITGTKGKTTVTRLVDQLLLELGYNTIKVDTQQVSQNGTVLPQYTPTKSMVNDKIGLAVRPGRFIKLANTDTIAILETSIGCSVHGLGYDHHDVGVFLNVFDDHLNPNHDRLNRNDIARDKSFIFSNISPKGVAVYNADDRFVLSKTDNIHPQAQHIIYTTHLSTNSYAAKHIKQGGRAVVYDSGQIWTYEDQNRNILFASKDIEWTCNDLYPPSRFNLLALIATLWAILGKIDKKTKKAMVESRLSDDGGRLVWIKSPKVDALCDYAHESESLRQIGILASKLDYKYRTLILRLAPRPSASIRLVANAVSPYFDKIIIYNKYDGQYHTSSRPDRLIANHKTTMRLLKYLSGIHGNTVMISREDDALAIATSTSPDKSLIVHIVHDQHAQSVALARDAIRSQIKT